MKQKGRHPQWLLPVLLVIPLPAMAGDFPGMLTVFVGLPLLVVATALQALLLIFRRHAWARGAGTLLALPVLFTGIYIGCVDTWRFWPDRSSSEMGFRLLVILGCGVLWIGLLWFTRLLWKAPSPPLDSA